MTRTLQPALARSGISAFRWPRRRAASAAPQASCAIGLPPADPRCQSRDRHSRQLVASAPGRGRPPVSAAPVPPVTPLRAKRPPSTPSERALVDRDQHLSLRHAHAGRQFRAGRPGRPHDQGELYLQKPGQLRFEYDDPSPIQLIADGTSLVVRDRRLATQDLYPLGQTPLRFLLADKVDLLRDTNVVGVIPTTSSRPS